MDASAAGTGVRVDSLSFCRLECDHSELFLPEYKRSNRTKGLKILRCFPHCCPNHIERSYCGSSLHVIVQTAPLAGSGSGASGNAGSGSSGSSTGTGSGSATRARLADNVFLFARFECSSDDGLRVGDTLASSAVVRDTQSEDNPEGTWIPGIKERASALASAMKRVAQAISDHTLVYQLNGKVYSRWYYDWESGANKAQRLMRHVLKAYVFERCESEDAPSGGALRVVGVVASPEFTVISYRRAPSEGLSAPAAPGASSSTSTTTKADAAPREPSPSMGGGGGGGRDHADARYDGRRVPGHHGHATLASKRLGAPGDDGGGGLTAHDSETKRRRRLADAAYEAPPLVTLRTATQPELFEDRVLWEHANARLVTVSKNLALVYYFVQWTPLDYYAAFVDELVHLMNRQVLEPLVAAGAAPGQKLEKLNAFARVLLDHAQLQPSSRRRGVAPPVLSRELDVLLRAMAQAAMWFFSEEMRWWTREFVARHAAALTDKALLRRAFLQWLVDLEAQLDRAVFAASPLGSLANAAEEIIAAVYTHELFHPKRPVVRQILGEHGFLGWRAFVAQMRDSFIAFSSAATRNRRAGLRTPSATSVLRPPTAAGGSASATAAPPAPVPVPLHPVERAWTGDWALDVEESTWKPQDALHADALSLVGVLDLMAQLARVQVALQLEQRLLCVASRAAFATAQVEATRLVLDGKSRVFRFAPHGWSTAMGEGADGDYIGSTRFEAPDRLIAYLETFRWARAPGARSYHVRMRIECWKQQRLFVNGEVLETVSTAAFPHEDLQFLPERTIGAKMKLVNRVFVRQPMAPQHHAATAGAGSAASGPIGPSPPSAWRRLGGFRLVYARARR